MSNQKNTRRPARRRIAGERRPHDDTRPVATAGSPVEAGPAPATGHDPAGDGAGDAAGDTGPEGTRAGRGVPLGVLVALGVLALGLVAGVSWYGVPRVQAVQRAHAVDSARRTAPAAAERAAVPILSYSYKSLDTDRKSAVRFMTPEYRKQYVDTFDSLVKPNASKLKARVKAKVLASGVSEAEPDRARVLLYVDQTTTSTANDGQAQPALNRVVFDMVHRDGSWLVNGITSY